jgi:hypothetical protein
MPVPAALAAVGRAVQPLLKPAAKHAAGMVASSQTGRKAEGHLLRWVALAAVAIIALPVVVGLAFVAEAGHVLSTLRVKPNLPVAVDAYRAAEQCPFATDQTAGKAIGTLFLVGAAYVLTSDHATQFGGYKNPWGSQSQIPRDVLANVDPSELRAGGSVYRELGLHHDVQPGDWTTVLGWTNVAGTWVPNPLTGEHGVGFLLIPPTEWRAWVSQVPANISQHLSQPLDPFKPYDAFLAFACHLMHLEGQQGIGMAGVNLVMALTGNEVHAVLANVVIDAVASHGHDLVKVANAIKDRLTGAGEAFAGAVLDFIGRSAAGPGGSGRVIGLTGLQPLFLDVPPGGWPHDTYAPGNCTWWAAYNRHVPPVLGNGTDWLANAAAAGMTTSSSPAVRAIVVYRASIGYDVNHGHVAVVISVGTASFRVSEMNYKGLWVVDQRDSPWPDWHVEGFILG